MVFLKRLGNSGLSRSSTCSQPVCLSEMLVHFLSFSHLSNWAKGDKLISSFTNLKCFRNICGYF